MVKKRCAFFVVLVSFVLVIAGCAPPVETLGDPLVTDFPSNTLTTEPSTEPSTAPVGDGRITFTLNVITPMPAPEGTAKDHESALAAGATDTIRFIDAEQPQYLLGLMSATAFGVSEFVNPDITYQLPLVPNTPITINIPDFWNKLSMNGMINPLLVKAVVMRAEDPFLYNPLGEPIVLTFPDENSCSEGYEHTLNIQDESMTSLFPEGGLVISVVGTPEQKANGVYYSLTYTKPNSKLVLTYGGGVSGFMQMTAVRAEEIVSHEIKTGNLFITNMQNKIISDAIVVHFDEAGRCLEGRLIEFRLKP